MCRKPVNLETVRHMNLQRVRVTAVDLILLQ